MKDKISDVLELLKTDFLAGLDSAPKEIELASQDGDVIGTVLAVSTGDRCYDVDVFVTGTLATIQGKYLDTFVAELQNLCSRYVL